MAILDTKKFIQVVLIDEVGTLSNDHPYIAFIMMGIGIEFLGKCIDSSLTEWNVSGRSKRDFEDAIKNIPSLQKYEPFLVTYKLYDSFRCGLAHAVAPKQKITLSSKAEQAHLVQSNDSLNLKVEDLYDDFRRGCEHVISQSYPTDDKMNKAFLGVPGLGLNSGTIAQTGIIQIRSASTGTTTTHSAASGFCQ